MPGALPRPGSGRKRPRAFARALRGLAVAALLVFAGLLAAPHQALAQSDIVLVSNTGQTRTLSGSTHNNAQQFTTGSNEDGYVVREVKAYLEGGSVRSNVTRTYVTINSDDSDTPGATVLASLSNPSSFTGDSINTFTLATPLTLTKETKYWVVFNVGLSASQALNLASTDESDEDSDSLTGWSIADNRRWRAQGNSTWSTSSSVLPISIHGYAVESSNTATATQSAGGATWSLTGPPTLTPGETYTYTLTLTGGTKPLNEYLAFTAPTATAGLNRFKAGTADCTGTNWFCHSMTGGGGVAQEWVQGGTTTISGYTIGTAPYTLTLKVADDAPGGTEINLGVVSGSGSARANPLALTVVADASADATLSALALENAEDSTAISLDRTFAAATTSYTASVANGVDEITVTPTKNDSGASIEWLDGSNMTLGDADDMKTGHQVDLDVGANTIKIKVTAEDGNTTRTYTVAVTRAAALPVTGTFVSNTGKSERSGERVRSAQLFTTGGNFGGYTIESIGVGLGSSGSGAMLVRIFTTNSGVPVSELFRLTSPASIANGSVNTFTAPANAILRRNTEYAVVMTNTAGTGASNRELSVTESDGEDNGAAAGWSIDNNRQDFIGGGWVNTGNAVRIRITGRAVADASLSGLTLKRADNGNAIALSPGFSATRDTYRAWVANGVGTVTVTATATDAGASVQYQDENGTAIPDAEGGKDGQQVALEPGANTIAAKVTAGDGATETYTITVARAAGAPAADPKALWTANLTVGLDQQGSLSLFGLSGSNGALAPARFDVDGKTIRINLFRIGDSSLLSFRYVRADAGATLAGNDYVLDLNGTRIDMADPGSDLRNDLTDPGLDWAFGDVILVKLFIKGADDASLSNLELENAADSSAIALTPAFMSTTTRYTATVGNAVGQLTIEPTKSAAAAEVAYLDGNGMEIPDADDMKAGHQAALAVGANRIDVKVTAQDGVSTETYELTVTRGPPLWTTHMTIGVDTNGGRGFSRIGTTPLGALDDETFEYGSRSHQVRSISVTATNAAFGTRSSGDTVAGLVLEWAGEVLPLDEATRNGSLYHWSQSWLAANAPSLAAANFAATLPEGGRGLVCLRGAAEACPSTAIATNSPASGAPAVSGLPQAGVPLAASLGTVADTDGVPSALTWQWVRVDGANETNVGTDSATYTPVAADVGRTLKVRVSFTDRAGFSEGPLESAETATVLAAPAACPAGNDWCATLTAERYGDLSVSYGYDSAGGRGGLTDRTIEYSGTTYTVRELRYLVNSIDNIFSVDISLDAFLPRGAVFSLDGTEFTADAGSEQSTTGQYRWPRPAGFAWAEGQRVTVSIRFPNRAATGAPTIAGTASVGETLTAGLGDIADEDGLPALFPDDYSFRWVRVSGSNETDIAGATGRTYTLKSADRDRKVKVKVSFTDRRGASETRKSGGYPSTGNVAASGSLPVGALVKNLNQATESELISRNKVAQAFTTGSHALGYVLSRVTIQNGNTRAFGAKLCGTNSSGVPNTTCTTLTPPSTSPIGARIFTAPAGTELDPNTQYTVVVEPGSLNMNYRRTKSNAEDGGKAAGWSIADAYQRQSGSSWSLDSDGHSLRISIEGSPVANSAATGGPSISGVAAVGQTLTAGIGSIADENGLPATFPDDYDLQWFRVVGGTATAIPGATSGTYRLKIADAGAKLRLRAAFTDDGGSDETLTGAAWPATGTVVTMSAPSSGLVGNTGQETDSQFVVGAWEHAQGFRTGSNAAGYALESIGVQFSQVPSSANASHLRAELRKGANAGATRPTNATVAVLANPSDLSSGAGVKTFTAPTGTRLEPDTNYFLFVSYSGSGNVSLDTTSSDAEDAGRAAGWSIADGPLYRARGSTGSWLTDDTALKISVEGSVLSNGAIGMPTISGTPQAGQTLTASPDGIVDPDGLPASLTWQWVRVAPGGAETLVGFDDPAYTLVPADVGASMRVRASFTDNAGNSEGPLASAPTEPIAAAARACPADNIWCRTVTADDGGLGLIQLVKSSDSAADRQFSHDGIAYTVSELRLARSGAGVAVTFDLNRHLPRGTALHIAGHEVVTDADSERSGGNYVWELPEDFTLHDGQRVRLALRAQVNDTASGAPEISGKAQVGVTLLAGVGGISDPNGLAGARYSYQWVRVDADGTSNPTDIGTDAPSYTLTADDEGKRIRVRVSFTDDIGFDEGPLESNAFPATGTVAAVSMPPVGALVSNIGQGNRTGTVSATSNRAQQFTAGTAATVTGVDIASNDDEGDAFSLKLCTTNSSGRPTSSCTSLTAPGSFAKGTLSFTAPTGGIALTANTRYAVLVDPTSDGVRLGLTTNSGEDSGKAAGWSIKDNYFFQAGSLWTDADNVLRIAIKGSLRNTAATGAPAITGTPQPGGTLTADTSGISDVDGLSGVSWSYRWIRVAPDDTETVVALDSATYAPKAADVGHGIKLAVAFEDDNGNYETLESEEVGPVVAAARACPADNIWCRTVTADDSGLGLIQLVKSSDSAADRQFSHDGIAYTVSELRLARSGAGVAVTFDLNRHLPRGTALHIAGHEVVTDADSERSGGNYVWELPEDFTLHDGQRVRLALAGASTNALLGTLALEHPSDGTAVDLSPAFRRETAFYRAQVEKHVNAVTLRTETASSRAGVAVLDRSRAEFEDADETKDGFQLALDGGANRFRIRVTAEDNLTVRTYRLRVDRQTWSWATNAGIGTGADGTRGFSRHMATFGSLAEESFEYPETARKVTALTAGPAGVRLRTDGAGSDLAGLVLEWAGETLPLDAARRQGLYNTWSQPWLAANAPSLAAANYAATLPEGRRGKVCLRTAGIQCPSTRIAANSPATGKPTISGAPQVGETLTADTSAIRDANGLALYPNESYGRRTVDYSYQWVRIDGNAQIVIPGATSRTYRPKAADLGKTVKVKVAFTDDLGYAEGALASEPHPPSGAILPARAACPADAAWCSAITVGTATRAGTAYSGYSRAAPAAGAIDDGTADAGNRQIGIARLSLTGTGLDTLELQTRDVELPRGTVLTLDGTDFALDGDSSQGGNTDRWDRPASLSWTAGQKVTVSLKFPAWTGNTRLGALTLKNAGDDTAIAIDPAFSPGEDTYAAVVPSGVDKVTVEAEAEESSASVSWHGTRSSIAAALADADGKDGHQVALWGGDNDNTLFNVQVTAWDRTSRRYHVAVRRTDTAALPALTLVYTGRMDAGGVTMGILGTSSNAAVRRGGELRPRFSGVETASRCVGRRFSLRGPDGLPKTNVAWSLQPWVRNDGLVVEGNRMFTIGTDGQIRTVVGVDYPVRDPVGATRLRVSATDLDAGPVALPVTADVLVVFHHPQGYRTDRELGNDCSNPGLTVADAEAVEGPGATLDFIVSLRPAANRTVTVAYATSDGSATAPADYAETSGTLTFAPGETEKTVSVPVVDDTVEDSGETLALTLSNPTGGAVLGDRWATGTIYNDEAGMADTGPLTASLSGLPGAHDGTSAFAFTLAFGADVAGLDSATLKDSALTVTGGTLTKAERVTEDGGESWTLEVRPDGDGAVAIALPATTDCAAAGALCTSGGGMLAEALSATVPGPATAALVSIAPAASPVTEGTAAAFTLTRTGGPATELTVGVGVTEDGAAIDGEAPATVTFAADATTATLTVATTDDETAEAASAVTATVLPGTGYAPHPDAKSAAVTVEDDDAAPVVTTATPLPAAENATAIATLSATDEDTPVEDLAWSLAGGADADRFTLSEDGVLAFKTAKDLDAPDDADSDGDYEIAVRVTDGANPVDAALTVRLGAADATAPALTGASVDGTALTLAFDEALDEGSVPPASAFAVAVGETAREVSTVAVSGSAAILTLASAVLPGEAVTVGYTVPAGDDATPLRDAAGNPAAGFDGEAAANETGPANAAPTGLPAISGAAKVGGTLTASASEIADPDGLTDTAFAWQWVANDGNEDADIADATGASYVLTASEEGKTVRVRVTFTDDKGTEETLESAATGEVGPANAAPTGLPAISGAARVGGTLTASASEIADPDGLTEPGFAWQWVANDGTEDTDIADATDASYVLTAAEEGKTVRVRVTFTDDKGTEETLESAATGEVGPANAAPTGLPEISGAARVGGTLTASASEIADPDGLTDTAFAWQWVANDGNEDADIEGATDASYVLTAAEEGRTVRVRVTFTDDKGTEETLESAATGEVGPALPRVSIRAASSPVTEGAAAAFTLSRTGDTAEALTVAVTASEAGSVLSETPPAAVTFAAGNAETALSLATENDAVDEADARVTAAVAAGTGYTVDPDAASAGVDVYDNDAAAPGETAVTTLWSTALEWTDMNGEWIIANAEDFESPGWSEDGSAFTVWYFAYGPFDGDLWLRINSSLSGRDIPRAGELTLHVGEETVQAGDALAAFAGGRIGIAGGIWRNWEAGDRVPVRLTRTETAAASLPGLSVADAQVREADGLPLSFTVTLDDAQASAVSVRYATSDGTAVAPGDYGARSGMLRFEPGQTAKTVLVPVIADDHNEGSETMTLSLSQPFGARIADATATGTIVNTGPIPKAWIARFGRTVADQVLAAVQERLGAARAPGAEIGLGGQRIGLGPLFGGEGGEGAGAGGADEGAASGSRPGGAVAADAEEKARLEALTAWLNGEDPEKDEQERQTRSMTGREVLMGSSFNLAGQTKNGGFAALWGRIAQSRFAGREGTLSVDGDVTTGLLGLDRAWDRWTTGLVVSRSTGTGGYGGEGSGGIEATMTAVTPWAGYAASETLSVWGAAGYGAGELTVKPDGQAAMKTDLSMKLAAGGLRATLLDGDGPRLDAVTGARWVRTSSARLTSSDGNLAAATADVWRLTLGLDGAWPLALGDGTAGGATATPRLALGLRHDGGDAETGYGVDIAGGIDLALPAEGLTVSLSGRGVLTHEAAGLSDRGIAGTLAWNPGASGQGPSLSLSQTFGNGAASGKDTLLARETLEGLAANDPGSEFEQRRLEARFGYGFGAFGGGFTATPEVAVGLSQAGRDYSLGWRMVRNGTGTRSLEFSLEATRRESANDNAPPEHGVGLRLTARW